MKCFYNFPTIFALAMAFFVVQATPVVQGEVLQKKMLPERNITTVYPTELYPGENVLTFHNPDGIQEIKPMFDSLTISATELEMPTLDDCPDSVVVRVKVNTARYRLNCRFMVTSCAKKRQVFIMRNRAWQLDVLRFPDVQVGDTTCRKFWAGRASSVEDDGELIESITSTAPQVFFVFPPDSIPPVYHPMDVVYFFDVCFVADAPGNYTFPVRHQIQRSQPAGGHSSYIVADTGLVRVLPRESIELPSPGGQR